MRLLQKQKFDQAEEFAKQFNLDVEVYKSFCLSYFSFFAHMEGGNISLKNNKYLYRR